MTLKRKYDEEDDDDDIQILGVINDDISIVSEKDDSNDSYSSDYREQAPKKMIKTSDQNNNSNSYRFFK